MRNTMSIWQKLRQLISGATVGDAEEFEITIEYQKKKKKGKKFKTIVDQIIPDVSQATFIRLFRKLKYNQHIELEIDGGRIILFRTFKGQLVVGGNVFDITSWSAPGIS